MYKKKETAIRNLHKHGKFWKPEYNLFRSDEEVALEAIKLNYSSIDFIDKKLLTKEFVYKALEINPSVYAILRNSANCKDDFKFLELSARYERFMYFQGEDVRSNKHLAMISVHHNGGTLLHLSNELKNDKEVVLEAVKQKPYAINFASKEIQELCKGSDPAITLERLLLAEQLNFTLNVNSLSNKKRSKI